MGMKMELLMTMIESRVLQSIHVMDHTSNDDMIVRIIEIMGKG